MEQDARNKLFDTVSSTVLQAVPNALAIYVYGSYARGDEFPDSDIDVAVLLPHSSGNLDLLRLIAEISISAGIEADLVDLRHVSLDLIMEVMRDGKQLYVSDPEKVLVWEAERMTEFGFFNVERAEILDAYSNQPVQGRP